MRCFAGNILRLDHQMSAHILVGKDVCQLCQIMVILDGWGAFACFSVNQERCAIPWGKNGTSITDGDIPLRVAGVDCKLPRDRFYSLHDLFFGHINDLPLCFKAMLFKDINGIFFGKLDTGIF